MVYNYDYQYGIIVMMMRRRMMTVMVTTVKMRMKERAPRVSKVPSIEYSIFQK